MEGVEKPTLDLDGAGTQPPAGHTYAAPERQSHPAVLFSDDGAMRATEGASSPNRLGVHLMNSGVDVAVVAPRASRVDFCLIGKGESGVLKEKRISLLGPHQGVWHAHIPGVQAGDRYGFRVWGHWDPAAGLRHNPAKLLLDPYARGISGTLEYVPAIYGHKVDENCQALPGPLSADPYDSAPFVPHATVIADESGGVAPHPRTAWDTTVIYEAHVRGLTARAADIPEELRGTYAGMAHPAMIAHLKRLGITAIELLPIHASVAEPFLGEEGRVNYWGYNTLAFFAPEPRYATAAARAAGPQAVLAELKGAVSLLHEAGIEVLLDVVYNHTCEGGTTGPTLSWRGLDSVGYYVADPRNPERYIDYTGCGNSLDFRHRRVLQMALDSLRYWVREVGIDGFRFDLAVTSGRSGANFSPNHPFWMALATDETFADTKLITEPWDLGPDGWRTGQFPAPIADWNDRYRDAIRTFWLSDPAAIASGGIGHDLRDFATRLAGSADLFSSGELPGGRGPLASINLVTAHDGFTAADLTTYNVKHNEANGEGNRDGSDNNRSWNHGLEGPAPAGPAGGELRRARRRSLRNMLGTLLVSAGTPMLTAGDEFGRTQHGNNNAYCQDNEISHLNWDLEPWQEDLISSISRLIALRTRYPALRPTAFATGAIAAGDSLPDIAWFTAAGTAMEPHRWHDHNVRVLQLLRSGTAWGGEDIAVLFNGHLDHATVKLPKWRGRSWQVAWDSAVDAPDDLQRVWIPDAAEITLPALSMRVLVGAAQ